MKPLQTVYAYLGDESHTVEDRARFQTLLTQELTYAGLERDYRLLVTTDSELAYSSEAELEECTPLMTTMCTALSRFTDGDMTTPVLTEAEAAKVATWQRRAARTLAASLATREETVAATIRQFGDPGSRDDCGGVVTLHYLINGQVVRVQIG